MTKLTHNERLLMDKLNELVAAVNALASKISGVMSQLEAAKAAAASLPPTAVDGSALQPVIDAVNAASNSIPA